MRLVQKKEGRNKDKGREERKKGKKAEKKALLKHNKYLITVYCVYSIGY